MDDKPECFNFESPMLRLKKNLRLKYSNVFSMQKGVPLNHKTTKH